MIRSSIIVFVDQEKAFECVNRDKLWKILEHYDIKGQLLDNIRAIYANSKSAVRTPLGTTNWFPVTGGSFWTRGSFWTTSEPFTLTARVLSALLLEQQTGSQ